MKFIAQVLVYDEGDCLQQAIEPWLDVCKSIDIFEGAFQTTVNLGYPRRSSDGTVEIAKKLRDSHSNVTFTTHNDWNEPILRNNHLFDVVKRYGRKDTCLFILDGDEIYSQEDVAKCIKQVTEEWNTHNRWWVSMKNYINPNEYYMGFRVPRFAKLETALGFDSYNGIAYSDGVKEIDIKDVLPKHMSWTPLDKARRKIEWQTKALGWMCSFKEENNKIVLNDEYYQTMGKVKPDILND